MPKRRERAIAALDQPHPIYLHSTSEDGADIIRFLGPIVGILTHRERKGGKERSTACPGVEDCPRNVHMGRTRWKGYAAAQYYQEENGGMWLKCVFEVTEALRTQLAELDLRGSCWRMRRGNGPHNTKAIIGEQIEGYDPDRLPPAFDVKGQVCKVYNTTYIKWNVKPLLEATPFDLPSDDAPPRCVQEAQAERAQIVPIDPGTRKKLHDFMGRLRTGEVAPEQPDRKERRSARPEREQPQQPSAPPEPSRNGSH